MSGKMTTKPKRKRLFFSVEPDVAEKLDQIVEKERSRTGYWVTRHDIFRWLVRDAYDRGVPK